jgi:ribosome maturation factor RimP
VGTAREKDLQTDVERTLAQRVPEVEVLLAEQPSPGRVRVWIDRAEQPVDLELCERVTRELSALRDRYALEVSSPGAERPLTKPGHFQRVVGEPVSIRTERPVDGQRRFQGRLVDAGQESVEIDQDGRRVRIPYDVIRRSHLVFDPAGGAS